MIAFNATGDVLGNMQLTLIKALCRSQNSRMPPPSPQGSTPQSAPSRQPSADSCALRASSAASPPCSSSPALPSASPKPDHHPILVGAYRQMARLPPNPRPRHQDHRRHRNKRHRWGRRRRASPETRIIATHRRVHQQPCSRGRREKCGHPCYLHSANPRKNRFPRRFRLTGPNSRYGLPRYAGSLRPAATHSFPLP